MIKKQNNIKNRRFIFAFLFFLFSLFLFSSCPQPGNEIAGFPELPPAAPALPEVRPGNKKLILSWAAVPGAGSYEVFYGTEPGAGASPAQTVNVPAASISGLENGTTYYVRLRAKNSIGVSGFSPQAEGTPLVQTPSPSVVQGNNELSVGWAAEEGVDYEVWYGTSSNSGDAAQSANGITRSGVTAGTTITGLGNGTVYYVWIKTGDNGFGEKTAGTPEAPAPVSGDFVYVPGGTVTGSSDYAFTVTVPNDSAYNNPGSTSIQRGVFVEDRRVTLDSFVMAKYETAQKLWYDVQDWALDNGYQFQNKKAKAPAEDDENKPVTGISWRDAIVWCNAYSEKDSKQPVYTYNGDALKDSRNANAAACDGAVMNKDKTGYRLPTEVEREFAARGGDPSQAGWMYTYAGSNNAGDVAWHHGNSAYTTQEAGKKIANPLGLYDLSGNAQEGCWDWMNWAVDVTADTPPAGGVHNEIVGGRHAGNQKAFHGGGVGSNITYSCVAYRWGYSPDYTNTYVGFRVVRKP
jgi:formylglycine-generating enzyme required for sulfatase activity